MRLSIGLVTLATLAVAAPAATTLEFTDLPWGRFGVAAFDSAPYPHPSRDEGFASSRTFYPRDPHYLDSTVGVLVPSGFEPGREVDLIVHFHGHGSNVCRLVPQFELGEMLEASGLNAVMVVPQGPHDASDSRFGKLDEPGGFAALIEETIAALREAGVTRARRPGRIAIMGHSGGYHTLGQIIANGDLSDHIAELWLFDATYAQLEDFVAFAERPETRVRSIFTGHLAEENVDVMCDLQQRGVPYLFRHDTLITDEDLAANRLVFMHTDLGHNDVMHGTRHMERWMRASGLARRP